MRSMINEITESFIPIMSWLADLFQSHPVMATYYTTVVRFIFVALALFVVFRAIRSPALRSWKLLLFNSGSARRRPNRVVV